LIFKGRCHCLLVSPEYATVSTVLFYELGLGLLSAQITGAGGGNREDSPTAVVDPM